MAYAVGYSLSAHSTRRSACCALRTLGRGLGPCGSHRAGHCIALVCMLCLGVQIFRAALSPLAPQGVRTLHSIMPFTHACPRVHIARLGTSQLMVAISPCTHPVDGPEEVQQLFTPLFRQASRWVLRACSRQSGQTMVDAGFAWPAPAGRAASEPRDFVAWPCSWPCKRWVRLASVAVRNYGLYALPCMPPCSLAG